MAVDCAETFYKHTQTVPIVLVLAVTTMLGTLSFIRQGLPGLAIVALLAVLYWFSFSRMTIKVSTQSLEYCFGNHFFRKTIKLEELADYQVTRNHPFQGWGIRFIGSGWLYNIYGLSAVELRLKDKRVIRLGTDEPEKLIAALDDTLRIRKPV